MKVQIPNAIDRFFLAVLFTVGAGCASGAGSGGTTGSGGTASATGGAEGPTGGVTTASGGIQGGTGGAMSGVGGATTGSGGATQGTGGATRATGGATSGTGGATGAGGSRDAGPTDGNRDVVSTGGNRDAGARGGAGGSGGVLGTGGTVGTGGATGAGGGSGKVFSQCRFHFGTIDSIAKNAGASMISQLDFFTPGWMLDNFNQGYVCTESAPGGPLAGLIPVDVTYVAANYVKKQHKLCDCNVSGCSGGDLCKYGAQYITQNWAAILAVYASNSAGFAGCLGGRPIIFAMEPDWYQYTISGQTQPWSPALAGTNMTALVNALKGSLPNAFFSMDISPWIANNGASWYTNFDMSLFTFIHTSGGGTDANNTRIRANNTMTWAGVNQVTGKPILADTGYGAAGASAGEDANWNVAANINARIADGVISISQYNPSSGWGNTIAGIRGQLKAPRYCP